MRGSIKLLFSAALLMGGLALTGCSSDKAADTAPDNSSKIIKPINTNCGTASCI